MTRSRSHLISPSLKYGPHNALRHKKPAVESISRLSVSCVVARVLRGVRVLVFVGNEAAEEGLQNGA